MLSLDGAALVVRSDFQGSRFRGIDLVALWRRIDADEYGPFADIRAGHGSLYWMRGSGPKQLACARLLYDDETDAICGPRSDWMPVARIADLLDGID
jgi:hypothetical protein